MGENPFLHQEKVHNFKSTKNAVFVGPKKALIFGLKLYFFFYISGHSGGGEREGNKCSNENEASLLKKLFDDLLLWRRGYHEGFIFVDWFTIILKIYIEFLYIFFFLLVGGRNWNPCEDSAK